MPSLKILQVQLYQMSETTFNGVSLFATTNSSGSVTFNTAGSGNTVSIFTSATGEGGSIVSINKTALLAALTIDATSGNVAVKKTFQDAATSGTDQIRSFGSATVGGAFELGEVSVAVFTQALQNVATLRAENGGSVSQAPVFERKCSCAKD